MSAPNLVQQTGYTQDGCFIGHTRQFVFDVPVWKTEFEYEFVTIWNIWREETVSDLDPMRAEISSCSI